MDAGHSALPNRVARAATAVLLVCAPTLGFSQAASPFMTGATALQTNILGGWGRATGAVTGSRLLRCP